MYGKNPIRPPVTDDGGVLQIQSIFPTLQGEGPLAGTPAVFIRLGGCNLACGFCDTEFESFTPLALADILREVDHLSLNPAGVRILSLAVITGGEPLRQPIELLCIALLDKGFQVQIETNGTLFRDLPVGVQVVCSPKNTGRGYFPIREDLLPRITAFKFLLSATDPLYRSVPEVGQGKHKTPVFVQPMDMHDAASNAENTRYAIEIAMQRGYRLSLQQHKIVGIQ